MHISGRHQQQDRVQQRLVDYATVINAVRILLLQADLPRYAHAKIKLKNGRVLAGEPAHTRGSEHVPFNDEIMTDKFRTLAGAVLPRDRVEAIMQAVNRLESLGSVFELVPLLQK